MKTLRSVSLGFLLGSAAALAQEVQRVTEPNPPDGVHRIIERGPHHRTWEKITQFPGPGGTSIMRTNGYVELASGMHRWSDADNKWTEADDEIEIVQEKATSSKSAYRVDFSDNANALAGTIDFTLPDNKQFRSRVVGIAYTALDTGKSVFVAEVKDAQGFVLGRNQVIYINAFDQANADIRYTTTRSSFEQDVILREQLPAPSEFGFKDHDKVLVEVWTEMIGAPQPNKRPLRRTKGPDGDEGLDFGPGSMFFGESTAFQGEGENNLLPRHWRSGVRATKQWLSINGRDFLIEAIPYSNLQTLLGRLPKRVADLQRDRSQSAAKLLAEHSPNGVRGKPISLAQLNSSDRPASSKGKLSRIAAYNVTQEPTVVLDYALVAGGTDYTFKSDTTYYVTNVVNFSGTVTFDGGAVIKYSPMGPLGTGVPRVAVREVICNTAPYRPAVFTARDDDTVGEILPTSTGTPSSNGYYAYECIMANYPGSTLRLHDMRFQYAYAAYTAWYRPETEISNVQIQNCEHTVYAAGGLIRLRNVLSVSNNYVLNGQDGSMIAVENMTCVGGIQLIRDVGTYGPANSFYLTNCLVADVTSTSGFSGSPNQILASTAGVFQSVGAGGYYLAAGSPHRNAGTTSIHPLLLADLKTKTTYPPILLTSDFASTTVLAPQAQRDSDAPDLGYHYTPLDYIFGRLNLSEATLTLTNGVAVGLYGDATFTALSGSSAGLTLKSGAVLISQGTPTRLNWLVPLLSVQEQHSSSWNGPSFLVSENSDSLTNPKELSFRFTGLSCLASPDDSFHFYFRRDVSNGNIQDCQFYGGEFILTPPLSLWNNLFERVGAVLDDFGVPVTVHVANNLFRNGLITLTSSVNNWPVHDNLFDNTLVYVPVASSGINHHHNAYLNTTPLSGGTGNVNLTGFTYAAGPLGPYYHASTALNDVGSSNADDVGLYHYTTRTDQTKEMDSTVNIGFHYVATELAQSTSPLTLQGLIGGWTMDEGTGSTILDISGSGLTGTLNGPSWGIGPLGGGSLGFDGVNDYVQIPDNGNGLDVPKITIACWVYKTSVQTGNWRTFVGRQSFAVPSEAWRDLFWLGYDYSGSNLYSFYVRSAGGQDGLQGFSSIGDVGVWVHIAATYDGTTVRLYRNGVEMNSSTHAFGGDLVTDTTSVTLGGAFNGPGADAGMGENAHVYLDDVRIFNRALSGAEIQAFFNNSVIGLVGAWPMNEGTGTTVADSSGFSNQGSLINGPTWMPGPRGGSALSFDGVNDYMSAPDSFALDVGDKFTYAFWLKRARTSVSDYEVVMSKGSGTPVVAFLGTPYGASNNKIGLFKYGSGTIVLSTVTITDTADWHHYTFTKEGSNVHLYIDGVDRSGTVTTLTTVNSSSELHIGAESPNVGAYLGASMDDVRMYKRALSAAEVEALFYDNWDRDRDGVPDYLEDVNGNGNGNDDPTSWQSFNSLMSLFGPFNDTDSDGDGIADAWDYYPANGGFWANPFADPYDVTAPTITLIAPPNVTAQSSNTGPMIVSIIPDPLVTKMNVESGIATVTLSDAETPAGNLQLTVANITNPALVRSVQFGGSNPRLMIVIPHDNQTGSATITLRVMDAQGLTGDRAFTFIVNP